MSDRNSENLGGNRGYSAISGSEVGREGSGGGDASGGPAEWGPAIAVGGKRPGFVREDDRFLWKWREDARWQNSDGRRCVNWSGEAGKVWICLPADHPYYRQTEEAPLDWSGELEAVHEDGRAQKVRLSDDRHQPDSDGDYTLEIGSLNGFDVYRSNGSSWSGGPWRIRNTPQPTPQADTKPDLTARMEALVRYMKDGAREILKQYPAETTGLGHAYSEAVAIYELMNPAVDPDEQYARDLIREQGWSGEREIGSEAVVAMIVKTRRALALAGEKEA